MSKKFTLYWTKLERFEQCPQKFLWYHGWGDIDVGGGPGRKKPVPLKSSHHHAVMGIVIQDAIEQMYNQEWWKTPHELPTLLIERLKSQFTIEIGKNFVDWRVAGMTRDEMFQTCQGSVFGYLKTMKAHRLVGQYAKCEVEQLAYIDKWNPIGGKLDFLIRRDDEPLKGITILDGKNSVSRGKYTDPDQLRFYALAFYLQSGVMPNRLGFVYFRYPHGYLPPDSEWEKGPDGAPIKPEPETGIEWIPFTRDDLKGLAQRAVDARKLMEKKKFPATPKPAMCKMCDYESVCPERQAQKEANRRSPKNTSELFDGAEGFISFGMDD